MAAPFVPSLLPCRLQRVMRHCSPLCVRKHAQILVRVVIRVVAWCLCPAAPRAPGGCCTHACCWGQAFGENVCRMLVSLPKRGQRSRIRVETFILDLTHGALRVCVTL